MRMIKSLPPNNFSELDNGAHVINLIDTLFDEIYLVGGAIRDDILHKSTKDLDFAVPNSVEDTAAILTAAGFPVRVNATDFGTIGTNIGEYDIQITTYRSEIYEPGSRKPSVATIVDIDSDLERRDFTINAMALSRDEFIDPFGGYDDINSKVIRSVRDPVSKFKEDPLRILRAYRLVSALGYDIDTKTLDGIKQTLSNISIISSERIGEELKKLMRGDYWSDAVYELAEMGVLNECLRNFEIGYKVDASNVIAITDLYSQKDLKEMDEAHRWATFISILNEAEVEAGTSTVDILSTVENVGLKSLLPKSLRTAVRSIIDESNPTSQDTSGSLSKIDKLSNLYNYLKELGSYRAPQIQAKLLTEKGKDAFYNRQYSQALRYFGKALELTNKGYDDTLKSDDNEVRQSRLRAIKSYYMARLSYIVASRVLQERLHSKFATSEELHLYAEKYLIVKEKRLNSHDGDLVIDEAMVIIYKEDLYDSTIEPFEEFIKKPNLKISKARAEFHERSYLRKQLKEKNIHPSDKMKIFLKLSHIAEVQSEGGKLGLDYYEPYVDYLFNRTLSAENLDDFWKLYDELSGPTGDYVELTKEQGKEWFGRKRALLNSAASLIYGLSLTKHLSDKIYISKQIVADYRSAGRAYEKNERRFNVYYEWFLFLEWMRDKTGTFEDINAIIDQIKSYESFGYIDVDEEFFVKNLKEIANIRDRFIEIYILFVGLLKSDSDKEFPPNASEEIRALSVLYNKAMLGESEVFLLLKNYILMDADASITASQMALEDMAVVKENESIIDELIRKGESTTTEFKASWKYDVKRSKSGGGISGNKDITEDIIKTISAFMNTEGGTILVGINDDTSVGGLEETDFKLYTKGNISQKIDTIKKEIDNLFKERIGQDMQSFKKVTPEMYKGKTILVIEVKKSQQPVFCNEAFYSRGEAGSIPLNHREFTNYLAQHFV